MNYKIKIPFRRVYFFTKGTLLTQIYKKGFDEKSLSSPTIIDGWRTFPKIISKLLLPRIKQTGHFQFNNSDCSFDTRNTQFHAIYFNRFIRNGYEPEVMALLDMLLDKNDTFYDVGANWGYFTGYIAARKDFKGEIIAFEPQKNVFHDLKKFIEQADIKNIKIFNIALGNNTKDNISISRLDNFHSGLGIVNLNKQGNIKLREIDKLHIKAPNIIKMDVEGFEYNVIRGGEKTILQSKPFILYENLKDDNTLINYLKRLDYLVYNIRIINIYQEEVELQLQRINYNDPENQTKNLLAFHKDKEDFLRKKILFYKLS